LTDAAVLAKHSNPSETSPTLRGKLIREHFLCNVLPPPPPDVDTSPPSPSETTSVREQAIQHMQDPNCAGCHQLMDPIGFAFEEFDAIGRIRDVSGGQHVDISGELVFTDVDGPFVGARELGEKLIKSEQAQRCFAQQLFRYALGRLERSTEASLDAALNAFVNADLDIQELIVALTRTDAFMKRVPAPGEVMP
jgi:hypothetical protein